MPITGQDSLTTGLAKGPKFFVVKASQTAEGAGTYHSLWKAAGQPGAGANPPAFSAGSGYSPTKATAGALPITDPTSPELAYLALLDSASATVAGGFILADRLWACSGFATNNGNLQSVTTPGNLPSGRDPNNGLDVQPWLEFYTAPGASAVTCTVTGTDAAGNTSRTWTYSKPANAESVGQMALLLPGGASPAATLGIRQVTSLQWSATTGGAGDVGVTLLRRLTSIGCLQVDRYYGKDAYQLGLPRVYDDACLFLQCLCSTTSTGIFNCDLGIAHA